MRRLLRVPLALSEPFSDGRSFEHLRVGEHDPWVENVVFI